MKPSKIVKLMAKHPILTVIAYFTVFTLMLVACDGREAEAGLPEGFEKVTVDKHNINEYAEVVRHKETRCYYTIVSSTQAVAIEQMFRLDSAGNSVPYCEKE